MPFVAQLDLDPREMMVDSIRNSDLAIRQLLDGLAEATATLVIGETSLIKIETAIQVAFDTITLAEASLLERGVATAIEEVNSVYIRQLVAAVPLPDLLSVKIELARPNVEAAAWFREMRVAQIEGGKQAVFSISNKIWQFGRDSKAALFNKIENIILEGKAAQTAAEQLAKLVEITPVVNTYIQELQQKIGRLHGELSKQTRANLRKLMKEYAAYAERQLVSGTARVMYHPTQELVKAVSKATSKEALQQALDRWIKEKALYHARTLARTELNRAFNENMRKRAENSLLTIGWRIQLSPSHPRPDICDDLTGDFLFKDGAKGMRLPPWHPNCVPVGELVSCPGVVGATESFYVGDLVDVETASGRRFSVTVKHPMFTPDGFVAAESLRIGDYLFSDTQFERMIEVGDDTEDKPTPIDEVFHALVVSGKMLSAVVPSSPEHFHGDGHSIKGDINVVSSLGSLEGHRFTELTKHICQQFFGARNPDTLNLASLSNLGAVLFRLALTSYGIMRGRSHSYSGFLAHLRYTFVDHFFHRTNRDLIPIQDVAYSDACMSDDDRDLLLTMPSIVEVDDFLFRFGVDQITSIHKRPFQGVVYDLQTVSTVYTIGGVLASNCMCIASPIIDTGYFKRVNAELDSGRKTMDEFTAEVLGANVTKANLRQALSVKTLIPRHVLKNLPKAQLVEFLTLSDSEIRSRVGR